MNIQNLSTETIQRLITLAIESSPTKAAYILLENVIVPEKIVSAKPIDDLLVNRRRAEQHFDGNDVKFVEEVNITYKLR